MNPSGLTAEAMLLREHLRVNLRAADEALARAENARDVFMALAEEACRACSSILLDAGIAHPHPVMRQFTDVQTRVFSASEPYWRARNRHLR